VPFAPFDPLLSIAAVPVSVIVPWQKMRNPPVLSVVALLTVSDE